MLKYKKSFWEYFSTSRMNKLTQNKFDPWDRDSGIYRYKSK